MQQKFQAPPRRVPWFKKDIEGTLEERVEAFNISSEYLYKIIGYADKEEQIPEGELEDAKRIFQFCMQGPRAGHFRFDKREKLTSAEVLYLLTSSLPANEVCKRFNINVETVKEIRRGENEKWYWEYMLVRRLRAIIKGKMMNSSLKAYNIAYSISKGDKVLYYVTSLRKAKKLREDILTKEEFKRLTKENTIDVFYPIEKIEILK